MALYMRWSYLLVGLTIAPLVAVAPLSIAQPKPVPTLQPTLCPQAQLAWKWQVKLQPLPGTQGITVEQLQQTQAVLQQRIAQLKIEGLPVSGATVRSVSPDQLVIQLPIVNPDHVSKALFLPNQLEFRQQKRGQQGQVQKLLGERRLLSDLQRELKQRGNGNQKKLEEFRQALARNNQQLLALYQPTELTGTYIKQAEVDSPMTGTAYPMLTFDARGSVLIAQLTKQAAPREDTIGIFLDQELISAPTVSNAYAKTGITGGRVVISGAMSNQEAQNLANRFEASRFPLPVPLKVVSQVSIKPQPCKSPRKD